MYSQYVKRPFDVAFSLVLLIAAVPFMLAVAIAIKLESKGPVLFRQTRTGRYGVPFRLYKFRSMAANNSVYDTKSQNEITRVGSFIRKTSLDELPQLLNVLKGDMSFIGPRPWIPEYFDHMNDTQRRRCDVRPGITGIAQVYGRNNLSISQKIAYDLRYVDNIGLGEDCKVVFLTMVAVSSREGQEMGKGGIHEELDFLRSQYEKHETAPYGNLAFATSTEANG